MIKRIVILGLILGLPLCSTSAYAYDYPFEEKALTKFVRGVSNAATSWVEIPKQIYLVSRDREPLTGITYGTVKGLCYGVLRLTGGVYDTSLFLFPPYNDPLMEPEFIFEGFEAEIEEEF